MRRILLMSMTMAGFTALSSGCMALGRDLVYYSVSYKGKPVATPSMKSAAVSREQKGLEVGVNPFLEAEKTTEIFGANLHEVRILALQVLVRNNGQRTITVRTDDFILHPSAGKEYTPATPVEAAMRLEGSSGLPYLLAFGPLGYLDFRWAQPLADDNRRADFVRKAFRDTTLRSGQAEHGFLFYLIPKDAPELRSAVLVVTGSTDEVPAARISVELPLGDLSAWGAQKTPLVERPNF